MLKLPTKLGKGKGITGPEYTGCCNSGARPILYKTVSGNYKFIVCTELGFRDARYLNLFKNEAGKRVQLVNGGKKAWYFESYKTAKKKFAELCAEITDFNDGERKKHENYRVALKKHGPAHPKTLKAALALE